MHRPMNVKLKLLSDCVE